MDSQQKMKYAGLVIFFSATSLLLGSCSKTSQMFGEDNSKEKFEEKITTQIVAKWYAKTPNRFVLQKRDHVIPVHHFFDASPSINYKSQKINYVIETPARSPVQFKVDLKSGQHFFNQKFCKESDHSTKSGVEVESPPYHIGFIPRVFDQLGSPQKIFVFDEDKVVDHQGRFFTSRIVGGFVLRECFSGKCTRESDWGARLVLIGVGENSRRFKNVNTIADLKPLVDWEEVEAFVRNGSGSMQLGKDFYPSFKVGAMLSSERVLNYFKDNSLFFTLKKMTTLKKSCYKLYDYIWDNLGQDSPLEAKLREAKDLASQAKIMSEIKKNKNTLYNRRFARVFRAHHKNFMNCEPLVYSANINQNGQRKWFFSYYSLINILYSENYYYDCGRSSWRKSSVRSVSGLKDNLNSAFSQCSIRDLDKSFSSAKVLLNNLRRNNSQSYRYIDYDNSQFGTHNKLYSWVPIQDKRLECSGGEAYFNKAAIFPKDVVIPKRNFNFLQKDKVIF